ncbi:hypothetical protein QFC22_006581 [Naganishia vaughanmartiniae]|uniref:Uncharacterized protein n=1 Tax=Naganishia vaughanmartiniae TaxID=1424756 RepID=A0ACC2WK57_9TREE|nr:hypothetical protein QFC22_006581 [Naganishia vaughanmartiniae]
MAVDLPIYVLQTLVFSSIFYFLVGLNSGAKYFFTFWFTIFTFYLTLSCMYRAIGSWTTGLSVAIRYGALGLSVVLTTAGFIVPPPEQLGWISWLRRASPGSWAFESLMVNEFRTRTLVCRPSDLIPNGPAYADIAYQACTIIGATPGSSSVPGMDFVGAVYGFTSSHIWRNIGILWAMCSLYVILILVGSSLPVRERPGSSGKTYIRQRRSVKPGIKHVETQNIDSAQVVNEKAISLQTAPVYTFQDITYSVQVNDQEKVLLNSVTSTVKPGRLCALMGASGAGKTTLLDTVSLRKTTGVISGEMMIDGVPIDAFFSRKTGFAAQVDVHEPFSTVRECLQFSALLRQGNRRSREEKLAFAEKVLHLLELEPIADAIIGFPGRGGLNVEERKRVTIGTLIHRRPPLSIALTSSSKSIGVELAADPEFLLMLDEPTSGLDSQASYEIVRFLKKIAAEGLAVLCTIHQPSGDLFEMFDDVLLLAPGGNTVYTGPTGENASTVTRYFAERGCVCPPEANPAEFILSTVAPVGGSTIDWPQLWRDSAESQEIIEYIQQISSRKELGDLEITSHQKLNNGDYASSYFEQTRELILRNFRAQWRDGPFWLTQLVQTVFFGLFVGFYVFKVDHSRNAMQTVTLAYLVSIQSQPALTMDLSINYLAKLDLWRIRERLGIYSWYALATSLLVVALPMLVFCYTLTFLCFYWTVGMTSTGENGALVWLNYVAVGFNTAAFSLALGAISPNPETVPYLLSGLWNLYSALPSPFRYFFSWLSPLRYLFGSLETAAVADVPLRCTEADLVRFYTPSGQTCIEYAGSFLSTATGYLAGNTSSTTECFYCASDHGLDYIENLGYSASNKWRDWGIFLVWITSTVGMVYLLTWLCKVRSLYKKK